MPAERVVRSPNQIIEWRGQPQTIRVENGPEYVSSTLMAWAEKCNIRLEYIQPGKPQQNAYIERYNRTVRDEWLDQYIFETIQEAQDQATDWCLIPRFDGAIFSLEWKEALWDKYFTAAPRPRTPSEQQYSDRKLQPRR